MIDPAMAKQHLERAMAELDDLQQDLSSISVLLKGAPYNSVPRAANLAVETVYGKAATLFARLDMAMEHLTDNTNPAPKSPEDQSPPDHSARCTTDGKPADPACTGTGAPKPINPKTGQHESYWVLCEEERAKGFVRPVRQTYIHTKCGAATTMSRDIAETYARSPLFYGKTFCVGCRMHLPVGEFLWEGTNEVVGS